MNGELRVTICSLPMYAQTVSEDVDINTTSESATPRFVNMFIRIIDGKRTELKLMIFNSIEFMNNSSLYIL